MAATHVGQIILVANGLPILHVKRIRTRTRTGKEQVKGMSPTGKPIGHTGGTKTYTISATVYIPRTGDIAWENLDGAVIGITDREGGAHNALFTGCTTTEVGESYEEEGAAVRDVEMFGVKQGL